MKQQITIKKGLNIPIMGHPQDTLFSLPENNRLPHALNLSDFHNISFNLLIKIGDKVQAGQPLAEDKKEPKRIFASPICGTIKEIIRGDKRKIQNIVITPHETTEFFPWDVADNTSKEKIIETIQKSPLFPHIRQRPFSILADPNQQPRSIFIKALESAPFLPPAEMQVKNHENDFQTGISTLSKIAPTYLVYEKNSTYQPFTQAKDCAKIEAQGPHPISNLSIAISQFDPITSPHDTIWTLHAHDVLTIGHLFNTGHYLCDKIISLAGPVFPQEKTGYFHVNRGICVAHLIKDRLPTNSPPMRLISGDPLTGKQIDENDFLGFSHFGISSFEENMTREILPFLKLGIHKYSATRPYFSFWWPFRRKKQWLFTTNQHGEKRAFIDTNIYDKVMPLPIPTALLIKAIMAKDFEKAIELGFLEIASEDFALPSFICPSKIDMMQIVEEGIQNYLGQTIGEKPW